MYNELYETDSGDLFQGMSSEVFGLALQDATPSDVLALGNKRFRGVVLPKAANTKRDGHQYEVKFTKRTVEERIARLEQIIAEAEQQEDVEFELDKIVELSKNKAREKEEKEKAKQIAYSQTSKVSDLEYKKFIDDLKKTIDKTL
jgi:hypothetical protein